MARNNGIVHSAITRQLLERKLKKQISAVSLGDTAMDIQLLTQKVNTVQSSLSTIYSTLAGLVNQLDVFENITQNIQDSLATLQEELDGIIDQTLQKVSYVLQIGNDGVLSHTVDEAGNHTYEINNPFQSEDVFVQVVDEDDSDEIVEVSVEIEQEKITLYMAHCEDEGQYRVIVMG